MEGFAQRYYTGLQVTRDPGVPLVYAGFILMIAGCFVSFFMSHRQVCVDVREGGERCHVTVAGTANKDPLGMKRIRERLASRLSEV